MNENKIILQKHSATIAISNKLTLQQRKIYNFLLKSAKDVLKKKKDATMYKVSIGEIRSSCNLKDTNNSTLKASILGLMQTVVELNILKKDKKSWTAFTLLSIAEIKDGKLTYEFNSLIQKTIENPSIFALLDMNIIKGLSSKYSIVLYELIEDYKNVTIPYMEIDTFRKLMGVENKYKDFSTLKRRVIIPAVTEVSEKTEYRVEWEEIRVGRKVVELQFQHHRKPKVIEKERETFTEFLEFKKYVVENFKEKPICNKIESLSDSGNKYFLDVTFSISEGGFVRNDRSEEDLSPESAKLFWKWLFKNQERVGDISEIEEIDELKFEYVGKRFRYIFQDAFMERETILKVQEIKYSDRDGFYTMNLEDTKTGEIIVGKNPLDRAVFDKFQWL
jgi:plasmid replication initiation protein